MAEENPESVQGSVMLFWKVAVFCMLLLWFCLTHSALLSLMASVRNRLGMYSPQSQAQGHLIDALQYIY